MPALRWAEALRANDPFIVRAIAQKNAIGGDVYLVATKLSVFGEKSSFAANAGVRRTNAQKYGYGGNTVDSEVSAFGGIGFPLPIQKIPLKAPTFEVDQEPRRIKYVPTATAPTDLICAVRLSHLPDSRWSFDVGTGHVGVRLGRGINVKANDTIAFAANYRF